MIIYVIPNGSTNTNIYFSITRIDYNIYSEEYALYDIFGRTAVLPKGSKIIHIGGRS